MFLNIKQQSRCPTVMLECCQESFFDSRFSWGSEEKILRWWMSLQINAAASKTEKECLCISARICLNVQDSGPRLPTDEEAVQYPWPVRWRLYVSVLVHSLDWRSHIEGIHLILQMRQRGPLDHTEYHSQPTWEYIRPNRKRTGIPPSSAR